VSSGYTRAEEEIEEVMEEDIPGDWGCGEEGIKG
jgi:hypothetical protein